VALIFIFIYDFDCELAPLIVFLGTVDKLVAVYPIVLFVHLLTRHLDRTSKRDIHFHTPY
jgi:hypothetical protein